MALIPSGTSPGPDGFPVEWFKAFKSKIIPYLASTYDHSFNITHRLLMSLINADAKILAKVLTLKLEPLISVLVKTWLY